MPPTLKPLELVEKSLLKKAQTLKLTHEQPCNYVLKVCGRDEYLLKDYPLNQYQYIQDCISDHVTPSLLLIHVDKVPGNTQTSDLI